MILTGIPLDEKLNIDIDFPSYKERLYNVIQPVYDSAKMGGFTEWIK